MSTWGCHAAMLRTLERQPPADEALVGPQASVVRRKKLSRTSQLLTSGLLDSSLDEVQPLRKMKRALADERARRRRHEVAQREPTIFDAFAIHEGVEDLVIESDPPGLKTTRWLEAPDAKALRQDSNQALARAIQKLEKAAVFFARGSGFDGWSGPKGLLKPSAAFVAFEGAEFLKTDVKRKIRISTNCHLTTSEANALRTFEIDEKYFDGPKFVQWFCARVQVEDGRAEPITSRS